MGTDTGGRVISSDWLAHHAMVRPTKTAINDLGTGRRFTYAELDDRTERLASALVHRWAVRPGDRVAVLSRNRAEMFEAQFACWKLGAIFVPLNWRLTTPELAYIIGDCAPNVLLHDSAFSSSAAELFDDAHRLSWDGDGYDVLLAAATAGRPATVCTTDTILTIMYTSGTTGHPKGVIITHGMTLWNVVNQTEPFLTGSQMVNLVVLPLFHTGGLNCFANPAFHYGGSNVILQSFDAAECLRVLADPQIGITHLQCVPANYLFMSHQEGFATASFPTLVAAGVGGSAVPDALIDTWHDKGVDIQQAFGMTETGSMVMALPREQALRKRGSAGQPFMHNQLRLVGPDGVDVVTGEVGELWMRGPNITPGYWNKPDVTAASFTDGWFRGGDALRQDEEGYFYVVDRLKDIYISGGENVAPAEVENVIYQLDAVAEVAVIGVPDERWQEVGRAVIVVKRDHTLTREQVIEHCRTQLAGFKVPKHVDFVAELPHNATGKILKRALLVEQGRADGS